VSLSSAFSRQKAEKKELAAMLIREAQQTLQDYVSADVTTKVYGTDGTYYAPNSGGTWSADATGGWALAPGTHDISSLMNPHPVTGEDPYKLLRREGESDTVWPTCAAGGSCFFTYTVTDQPCMPDIGDPVATSANACKDVSFTLRFAD
jgi:hypothetical protein